MDSPISTKVLRREIHEILENADLTVISAKKVRDQIEKKYNCSLCNRKKEVDNIVMDFINKHKGSDEDDDDEDDDEDGDEEGSSSNDDKIANNHKNNINRVNIKINNDDNYKKDDNDKDYNDEEDDDDDDDDDNSSNDDEYNNKYKGKKRAQESQRKTLAAKKKRKSINAQDTGSESDSGSDSDYEIPKKQPIANKKSSSGGNGAKSGRKGTGFTRAYNLSPELSALMGTDSLPRHEVVKKVWTIIKERNLYDPKNKQFAICDDQLLTIMKVKRFRTFGMLKHLKPHFLN